MNGAELIRSLKAAGWKEVSTKVSHHKFKHDTKPGQVIVPHPKKDLPVGTVPNIFRQAAMDWPP
jgi:predicted RNA binding protein YcfA (HicA-like mRNA interferase family)